MAIRVFVVEDEKIVALDLQSRLEGLGYDVVGTAANGEQALSLISEILPDVVLLDVSLQAEMDGVAVAARIREQLRLPIVFITAYSDPDLIRRIQLTEPFAYVLKPFETVEVHAALQIAAMRARLEHQLIEQKQLLAATLDTIDDGVIVTGDDGMIRFMNPAAEVLTGWTGPEASCRPLHDVYRLADDGTLTARDRSTRRVESRSHLMKDEYGNWLGFVHTFADVTERELSRRTLAEREVEYRILMEQAADAIFILDDNGRFLAVNSKACELSGFSREELLKTTVTELIDPQQLEAEPLQFTELRAGRSIIKERRMRRKDGTYRETEVHAKMLADGRFQGILRDITGRKQEEAKFKEAVRGEVVDKLLMKLRVFAHGESAATNLNRLALFCDNPESLNDVSQDPGAEAPAERFRMAADEFLGIIAPELLVVSSLAAIIEADPVFGPAAQSLAGVSASLSAAVQSVRSELPRLLATAIAGTGAALSPDLKSEFRVIGTSVEDIRRTLHGITQALQTELTCDVCDMLKVVLGRFQGGAPPIVLDGEESIAGVRVIMKGADLSDVLSTLIQNALEALTILPSTEEKRVDVHVGTVDGKVRIAVEDNGPGVPEQFRDQIFDDLFSTKGPDRGFGLGHALKCLQGCGGTLRLDTTVEKGARFVVELVRV